MLSTGSTDVGDVSYLVPTAQFTAAAVGVPGTGAHTWQFAAQAGHPIGDKASTAIARAIAYASHGIRELPLTEQAKRAAGRDSRQYAFLRSRMGQPR